VGCELDRVKNFITRPGQAKKKCVSLEYVTDLYAHASDTCDYFEWILLDRLGFPMVELCLESELSHMEVAFKLMIGLESSGNLL
jgi:hypothetical protein